MIAIPEGKLARYFYGVQYLSRDLRLAAVVEASQHKIGTPVDYALLYCFHYDESQGKYTLAIVNRRHGVPCGRTNVYAPKLRTRFCLAHACGVC